MPEAGYRHDARMISTWHKRGTGMAQAWHRHGTRMAQAWYWHGTGMVQAWYRHGTGMVLAWHRHGTGMVQVWYRLHACGPVCTSQFAGGGGRALHQNRLCDERDGDGPDAAGAGRRHVCPVRHGLPGEQCLRWPRGKRGQPYTPPLRITFIVPIEYFGEG